MLKRTRNSNGNRKLFDYEPLPGQRSEPKEPAVRTAEFPVWTDRKANLIERYVHYFVLVTKHGTYLDGFAGPQEERDTESWAAKLVLASEPHWIRNIYLCDKNRSQVKRLEELRDTQPLKDSRGRKVSRRIHVIRGDFNVAVDEILNSGRVSKKEAVFCLLDQRMFECDWATVVKLAQYKPDGNKVELFYFLANSWADRSLAALRREGTCAKWWGRDDWEKLKPVSRDHRRDEFVARFKNELGYKSVKAWPIFDKPSGGKTMYYMIHATDHPEAPALMSRAYRAVVKTKPKEQMIFSFPGPKGPSPQALGKASQSA